MRLHLVDGTFELYRAQFSKRPSHTDPNGNDRKGTVGLVSSLVALLAEESVTHIAVAFDHPIRSFRNDLFAGYKSDEGVPELISAQFDAVEAAVRALGVVVWPMNQWECDDALATAAARWSSAVSQVRIMSPDKDLGQCLQGDTVVQVDRIRGVETHESDFRQRRGIAPHQLPDWLALVGDDADGIPGLTGFGERTASTLIGAYGSIEAIPDDPATWPKLARAPALADTLRAGREAALLYRRLATLVTDVPLAESLEDLAWRGVPKPEFLDWCDQIGASRLRERPHRWA